MSTRTPGRELDGGVCAISRSVHPTSMATKKLTTGTKMRIVVLFKVFAAVVASGKVA
jgi:hypothetical protein